MSCGKKELMATGPSVETRLACPEDLEQIAILLPDLAGPLFAERFPDKTVAEFCAWKYLGNPAGDAAVGIAVADGRVVSLAAGVPKSIRVGSHTLLAFELGDFITASDFRKRGLFSSLIRMVSDKAKQCGAAFVYVRPNPSSFRILTKDLSFREVQKLDERRFVMPSALVERKTGLAAAFSRRLGADWMALRALLPPRSREIQVEHVTRFEPEVDEWWAHAGPKFSCALARTHRYLNWRYMDGPAPYRSFAARRDGRFTGYVTTLAFRSEPSGYIVDLVTDRDDEESAGELLRCGFNAMLDQGATTVSTWTIHSGANWAGTRYLRKACPLAAHPPLHVAARVLEENIDLPADGWQLNLGDFDGI